MRRGAGLNADQTRGQLLEERYDLASPQPLADNDLARLIKAVNLKHALRDIQTNRANLHIGRLPFHVVLKQLPRWHIDAVWGAVHSIKRRNHQ
jgi:hypothetical protein